MAPNGRGKTKVAILGGGAAALTAAYELTATEQLRSDYDVTVYTLGWRLGGKCASGRNLQRGCRIEEHGLHVWFGFYDNSFRLMERVSAELASSGANAPALEDAFKPCDQIVLCHKWNGTWCQRSYSPPRNGLELGSEDSVPFWHSAVTVLGWVLAICRGGIGKKPEFATRAGLGAGIPDELHEARRAMVGVGADLQEVDDDDPPIRPLALARMFVEALADPGVPLSPFRYPQHLLLNGLRKIRDAWAAEIKGFLDDDDLRLAYMALDLATAGIAGMIEDRLLQNDFDKVNDEELRDWLRRHGADDLTLDNAPWLRAYYDLAFAYEGGNVRKPNLAAGAALRAFISMTFAYKDAMLWKMQGGMGDVVFAPLYDVLRDRVTFRFFSEVRRLKLSADKRRVEEIELLPQVEPRSEQYDPLIDVGGVRCWPSEPKWDLIKDGDVIGRRMRAQGSSLEWEGRTRRMPGAAPRLRHGEDFDHVILGISVGSLWPICEDLAKNPGAPAFRAMLQHSRTVMTQAFQLWVNRPLDALGWSFGDSITGSYVEPLDTYSEMDQLLRCEQWDPADAVHHIGYFCGVMQDWPPGTRETQEQANERAFAHGLDYMRNDLTELWPGARVPSGFDWSVLVDGNGAVGEQRLRAQYWRANVAGSERYVTTPSGSVDYRLKPHESCYDNLWLAGDWTRTGIDGGCVEAAVLSGMQAAAAISDGKAESARDSASPLTVGG